jgi:hypothetical protein
MKLDIYQREGELPKVVLERSPKGLPNTPMENDPDIEWGYTCIAMELEMDYNDLYFLIKEHDGEVEEDEIVCKDEKHAQNLIDALEPYVTMATLRASGKNI